MSNLTPPPDAVHHHLQSFEVSGSYALEVTLERAHVRLRPNEDDPKSLEVAVSGRSTEVLDAFSDHLRVRSQPWRNVVQITSGAPRNDPDHWRWLRRTRSRVFVDLHVPVPVDATVRAAGAGIDGRHLEGTFDFYGTGGDLQAVDLNGPLTLQARGGEVSVNDTTGDELLVEAYGGRVDMDRVHLQEASVRTVGAPLAVDTLHGPLSIDAHGAPVALSDIHGPCTARLDGHDLTYEGELADDTELMTVGGSLSARLEAEVHTTLSMRGRSVTLDESLDFNGTREERRLSGTVNGGGPTLTLRAIQGTAHCEQVRRISNGSA